MAETGIVGGSVVTGGHCPDRGGPAGCEHVLGLLGRKWVIPVLAELAVEPRRRKHLVVALGVSSSRLDPTVQELTRLGLIERAFIPSGRTDGPGVRITDLGRSFLELTATLSAWEGANRVELLDSIARWSGLHPAGPA